MKKIFLVISLFLGFNLSSYAQLGDVKNAVSKVATVSKAAGFDVNSLSGNIMTKLASSLALTNDQKPKVTSLITDFLTKKSVIMSLATSDKVAYASKLEKLTTTLFPKLKLVLNAAQYTKLLGLKPAKNTPTNVLSQLFY